jgi:hypothetical protein
MPGGSEWILILLAFPLYLLPAIVAGSRKHPNFGAVFALNLLLGWTFLGWVGSLIWSLSSKDRQSPTVIVNNTTQSYSPGHKFEEPHIANQTQPVLATAESLTQQEKIDQLRQLKQLLDEGVLTVEEFNKQKSARSSPKWTRSYCRRHGSTPMDNRRHGSRNKVAGCR